MSRIRETIYLDKNNAIDLILLADGVAVDLSSVTRMILRDVGCEWEVDSATSAVAFDWSAGGGVLSLRLGDETIPPGAYNCWLIVIDPTNTDGIVWEEQLRLTVIAVCTVTP